MKYLIKIVKQYTIPIIIVAIYLVFTNILFDSVCPLVILSGFPCPACGLTRACLAIMTGQFAEAWRYNATAYLWFPAIAWFVIMRFIFQKKKIKWEPVFIPICIITIGYYIYRMLSFFPGSEPLVYYEKNLVTWILCRSKMF